MREVNRENYKTKTDYVFHILFLFFLYGILGFLAETVFRNIIKGRSGKAGFLIFSPILPIYGFMGVVTYICARPLEKIVAKHSHKNNEILMALLVYLPFFAVSSAFLEISGGLILEYIYGTREWNYSGHAFNFMGYISLKFTLMFSIVGAAHMYLLFYPADKVIAKYSKKRPVRLILIVMTVAGFIDFIWTSIAIPQ